MQRRGEFIFADPIQFGERERAKEIGRVLQKLISACLLSSWNLLGVRSSKSNPVASVLSFSGALPVR